MNTLTAQRRMSGFTLIEMVVILSIIAAVAGLVIPRLDFVRRSADTSTAASTIGSVANNLQTHRVAKGTYPNYFDSLIEGPITSTTIYSQVPFPFSLGPGGPHYTVAPIAGMTSTTFSYAFPSGFTILNHTPYVAGLYASDSGSTTLQAPVSATTNFVQFPANGVIARQIYPPNGDLPANCVLFALGVGPNCSAIGNTMVGTPLYTTTDPATTYGRYIAIFACFPGVSGKRAVLKAVIDPAGQGINANLKNYFQNQNE